ncbi:hypothetical protein AAVH_16572 [Aphelenchoides avenae]|nr:hypothetical protein AAVH_16572 [Aphelenchus avenae]
MSVQDNVTLPAVQERTTSSGVLPASSSTTSAKQAPSRPFDAPDPATTMRTPATKIATKRRTPSRSIRSTDAPPAAPMPTTTKPAEAHHRRKARKRYDREPRT